MATQYWLHSKKAVMETRSGSASSSPLLSESFLAAAIALGVVAILLRNDPGGLSGDPDSYMHLARFRDGYGIFHGGFVPRDNAPYGTVLPWTMPMDGALALFYVIGRVFAEPSGALYFAARAVSPFFCASIGPLMFLGLRPFFDLRARVAMGGLAALSPGLLGYSLPGDADHHTMVLWSGVLFAVALVRYLFLARPRYRDAAAAGITAAFALWTSIEGFIVIGVGLSGLVLHRCLMEEPKDRGTWPNDLMFCGAFVLAMTAAWLLDPPYEGLWTTQIDRLSIVYVSFAWLYAAALIGLDVYLSRRTTFSRPHNLVVAALLGGATFLCWVAIEPDVIKGPLGRVDPALYGPWIDNVSESQPMWQLNEMTAASAVTFIVIWAAFAVVIARASGSRRWLWIAGAVLMIPLSLIGIRYIRASYYAEVFGAIPLSLVWADFTRRFPKYIGYGAVAASASAMLGPFGATVLIWNQLHPAHDDYLATVKSVCTLESLSRAIAPIRDTDAIVMAELDRAPMVLYASPRLRTVAAPFHRNAAGILDNFAFFGAHNDGAARAILDKRGVQYVLICDTGEKQRSDPFGERILHATPAWLQPLGASDPQPGFRLYRVRSGSG